MSGLTSAEAEKRLKEFGPNEIFVRKRVSFLETFRHEVTEPMILLLIFVGVVYSIWGALTDAITIFSIIFVLVFVEVYNEYRAKKPSIRWSRWRRQRLKPEETGWRKRSHLWRSCPVTCSS